MIDLMSCARTEKCKWTPSTLGQTVGQLVDADLERGYHAVTFDGSALASGNYFYRIEAGSFTRTMKMLLLK